jgi:hypothetical protein
MELEVPPRPPKLKESIMELPLPPPRKLELCRKVKEELVIAIRYTIDNIANIVTKRGIELTLENIVTLSLQIPVYIKLHSEIGRNMEVGVKYIENTSSFYVNFPVVEESILISGIYRESEDIIV